MKWKNNFSVLLALSVFVIIGMAAVKQPVNDKFKNLQVLPKNISEDSLDKIMDGFTVMLGVDCKYCHYRDKKDNLIIYEKDDKPEKQITRKMMLMTADINKQYFEFNENVTAEQVQAVTCYTCHREEPMPVKQKK